MWLGNNKKVYSEGVTCEGTRYENFKNMKCNYDPSKNEQIVEYDFFNHYNENKMYVQIPTGLLEVGKKFKLVMVCDPQREAQGRTVGEWLLVDGITQDN